MSGIDFYALLTIMIISGLGVICGVYFLIRNEWVCLARSRMIDSNFEAYLRGPSYGEVLYDHPFCWDIKKIYLKHKYLKHKGDMTPK